MLIRPLGALFWRRLAFILFYFYSLFLMIYSFIYLFIIDFYQGQKFRVRSFEL